jgi:hypothetical protein
MTQRLLRFEELKSSLEQLEHVPISGYHRIYYQTQLKEAIASYDRVGFLKYIIFAPRYHQLIERAKLITT